MNLPPKEDPSLAEEGKTKRKKLQRNTKGKGILKFGLSEEDISEEAESFQSSNHKGSGDKGKEMKLKKPKGAGS